MRSVRGCLAVWVLVLGVCSVTVQAQGTTAPAQVQGEFVQQGARQQGPAQQGLAQQLESRQAEIQELRSELTAISARLARLEAAEPAGGGASGFGPGTTGTALLAPPAVATAAAGLAGSGAVAATAGVGGGSAAGTVEAGSAKIPEGPGENTAEADKETLAFLRGTTLNFGVDGYYEYNFDHPVGRVNLLRAYDVSSNSFSLNQASVVIEHLPVAAPGKRFGGRIDLQFGQATETLQGSASNELRPQVYRNVFQAYGSYLAPVGSGLQVDFGKFASTLGAEGNYTKDQINYTRSYLFNYLPFYHEGFRVDYHLSPRVNLQYWLVNGAQQTEDFNGFKSQAFLFGLQPAKSVSWNINYYFGQEGRDVVATLNPGYPTAPTQPGLPLANIDPTPNGREHIFDTYATWNATPKLTLVGEADFVVNRNFSTSQPMHTAAGAAYLRYQLPRGYALAGRTEYVDDRSGLFSGTPQALKEVTLTAEHVFEPGFLARVEYRRDFSNQRFFLSPTAGSLDSAQPTATLGLVYWWGMKEGAW